MIHLSPSKQPHIQPPLSAPSASDVEVCMLTGQTLRIKVGTYTAESFTTHVMHQLPEDSRPGPFAHLYPRLICGTDVLRIDHSRGFKTSSGPDRSFDQIEIQPDQIKLLGYPPYQKHVTLPAPTNMALHGFSECAKRFFNGLNPIEGDQFEPQDTEGIIAATESFDMRQLKNFCETFVDDEIAIKALILGGHGSLDLATQKLKDHKDFVLDIVRTDGMQLEYASTPLKDDREMVEAAIREDGSALTFASQRLKVDEELKQIAKQNINASDW